MHRAIHHVAQDRRPAPVGSQSPARRSHQQARSLPAAKRRSCQSGLRGPVGANVRAVAARRERFDGPLLAVGEAGAELIARLEHGAPGSARRGGVPTARPSFSSAWATSSAAWLTATRPASRCSSSRRAGRCSQPGVDAVSALLRAWPGRAPVTRRQADRRHAAGRRSFRADGRRRRGRVQRRCAATGASCCGACGRRPRTTRRRGRDGARGA